MKILLVGDIVGSPGRTCFARIVARLRGQGNVDVVVANAENAAGGNGITAKIAEELLAVGADALTLGDHTWDQKEALPLLDREPRVIRPANFAPGCPGKGVTIIEARGGRVAVVNLVGRVFMGPYDCPFRAADAALADLPADVRTIVVDLHAEATSEKIAMGRYLDGRVTCVVGTHTHVQTSDEKLLPKGTAYITDLGMTGPKDSVLGRDVDAVLARFLTGMPRRFTVATDEVVLEGLLVDVDEKTGRARKVNRLRYDADG